MGFGGTSSEGQLTALLIAPDRDLARQFAESLRTASGFQIMAELRSYPPRQTLEIRLRQLLPEVVLIDTATDLERASELIHWTLALNPGIRVIGLHTRNEADAVLRVLSLGASDFLTAPFEPSVQKEAITRLRKMSRPDEAPNRAGKVFVFTSAKPGAGASTLAAQIGFALASGGKHKILLADLDPMSATVSFYLKLAASEPAGAELWKRIVPTAHGLDAVPSDAEASAPEPPPDLHEFIERARAAYDFVLLDLPAVFHRSTLLALPESDRAYLVTTPELPSLHLARKAVAFLAQLGFGRERIRVLVNRMERRSGLTASDVEKILGAPVYRSFPNDYFVLDRALMSGKPIDPGCDLAAGIGALAQALERESQDAAKPAQSGGSAKSAEVKV